LISFIIANSFIRASLASSFLTKVSSALSRRHECIDTLYGGLTRPHKDASAIMRGRLSAKSDRRFRKTLTAIHARNNECESRIEYSIRHVSVSEWSH